jgi:hypothetical protein
MEGEVPETVFIEDCEHWVTTYSELLAFKGKVIATAEEASAEVGASGQMETAMDLQLLHAERSRLLARLDYWQQRRRELGARPTQGDQ